MVPLPSSFLWSFSAVPLWLRGIPSPAAPLLNIYDRLVLLDRSLPVERLRRFSVVVRDESLPGSERVWSAAVSEAVVYYSQRRLLRLARGSQDGCSVDAGAIVA